MLFVQTTLLNIFCLQKRFVQCHSLFLMLPSIDLLVSFASDPEICIPFPHAPYLLYHQTCSANFIYANTKSALLVWFTFSHKVHITQANVLLLKTSRIH